MLQVEESREKEIEFGVIAYSCKTSAMWKTFTVINLPSYLLFVIKFVDFNLAPPPRKYEPFFQILLLKGPSVMISYLRLGNAVMKSFLFILPIWSKDNVTDSHTASVLSIIGWVHFLVEVFFNCSMNAWELRLFFITAKLDLIWWQ